MAKKFYTSPQFTVLVAGPGRTAFTDQIISDSSGNNRIALLQGAAGAATLQITVSDANLTSDVQAEGTVTVGIPLAGDILTIGGVPLTGFGGARTPGNDDFNVGAAVVADEIAAALNDGANSFAAIVTAASASPVVTLTAVPLGEDGNSVALASSTAQMTASGTTLVGGTTGGESTIHLGENTITSGIDWTPVNGNANASATALAAAIDGLAGYTAVALGANITITGPTGPSEIAVSVVYEGSGGNFTLTPNTSVISGTPTLGPPTIL